MLILGYKPSLVREPINHCTFGFKVGTKAKVIFIFEADKNSPYHSKMKIIDNEI